MLHFNDHSKLEGTHAYLSASNNAWVNYDEDKFFRTWYASQEARRGSRLHALAKQLIENKVPLERTTATLNRYVNDAIGFDMTPEVLLYWSRWAYGTADAIKFALNKLDIWDLKNGVTEVNFVQLICYAALFCLEYDVMPHEIAIELRIYQNNDVKVLIPEPHDVLVVMNEYRIKSDLIDEMRKEDML